MLLKDFLNISTFEGIYLLSSIEERENSFYLKFLSSPHIQFNYELADKYENNKIISLYFSYDENLKGASLLIELEK